MKTNKLTIKNIFWKRTYLFIEYESKNNEKLTLSKINYNKKTNDYDILKELDLETKKIDKDLYRSKINITIAEGRNMLSDGKWVFLINKDFTKKPNISENILYNIDNLAKPFPYSNQLYVYLIAFNIFLPYKEENSDDEEIIMENLDDYYLSLNVNYYQKNLKPNRKKIFFEIRASQDFKDFIHRTFIRFAKIILNIYYQIISHLTPKKGNKILFMSENRERIMDNLEAIDKRIKERNLDKQFKISYNFRNIFKSNHQNPFNWISVITKIAKQDYIFVDDYVPIFGFLKLHKKTKLIQVWHAGFGFKLVGYGRFGINGSPHPTDSCHRKYTYGLIGNNNLKEIYSEVWGIDKDSLLATGMPRLEHFLDKDYMKATKEKLYKQYPNFKGKRIINFAPTYRGSNQYNAYYDYSQLDFDKLADYCKNNNSIIIFGKHHFIRQDIPIQKRHKEYLYDLSHIKLNDTYYITDVLITDYSSCFYDFLLLKKPVLFFTYDKAFYSSTRGVHRPIDKVAPGTVCNNFDELMEALNKLNDNNFEIKDFLIDKCISNKTLASDKVIDYVLLNKDVEGL